MKKLMKRGASLLLAFCLVLGGAFLIPQHAAALAVYSDFTDLADSTPWYANYLNQSFLEGFFYGTSVNTFEPNRAMTRGEAVTVLGRVHERLSGSVLLQASEQPYEDVKLGRYYTKYIAWAKENDLLLSWMLGGEEKRFAPNEEVTQNQLAGLLDWYIDQLVEGQFVLAVPENSWLGRAMADRAAAETADEEARGTVGELGILEESHLSPGSKVLRGESSAYFVRLYQALTRIEDRETPVMKVRYQTIALENGGAGTLLPMEPETEHAVTDKKVRRVWEVVNSYEEYQGLLDILAKMDPETAEGALEVTEETFEENNLLVIDCCAPGSPDFDASLRSWKYESNPAASPPEEGEDEGRTVNMAFADVDFNALGYVNQPRAIAKGCVFFFPVPKEEEVGGVSTTFYIQAEDGQAIGTTAAAD